MDSAVETLHTDRPSGDDLGRVIVYLPERLTRHGARLLRAVADDRGLTVLAGTSGHRPADSEVVLAVERLGAPPGGEPSAPTVDPMAVVDTDRTRIMTVSDADEEVREAVRAVVDAVRNGTPLDRIAILHASPEPYARLAYEQLSAAGLAMNGASVMPLTARVAGRTLLGLLALPDGDFRRDEVFSWLAGARLRYDGRPMPVTAWERISRDVGVVAGRAQWDRLLTRFADDRDTSAAQDDADPEAPPWRAERSRTEALRARGLRGFVLGLIDDLALARARPQPWAHRAMWARRHVDRLLDDATHRQQWPAAEHRAAERVDRALDRLGCLDAVEEPTDLDVFRRTLELELDTDLGRVGRMGEGVLVAPVSMGVGLDLDLVVVLGLAEGSFPGPTRDDSLLPDQERVATGDELPLRAARIERQHRQLLAALAGASRQLLCVPRGDLRRSQERVPSRWVLDIASSLAGEPWWSEELLGAERDWLVHVASFDDGLRRMAFPAAEQEYRLRSLMAHSSSGPGTAALAVLGDRTVDLGAEVVAARRSDRFTRFDGNLAGMAVPSPTERGTSATRLEGWASCPFGHFLRNILNVDEVENPEDELKITAARSWVAGARRPRAVHRRRAHQRRRRPRTSFAAVVGRRQGSTARRSPSRCAPTTRRTDSPVGRSSGSVTDAASYPSCCGLACRQRLSRRPPHTSDRRRAGLRRCPAHGSPPCALDLPDGRRVQFRGKADRVDIAEDGTVHVVDYKTGRPTAYADLSESRPRPRRYKAAAAGLRSGGSAVRRSPRHLPVRAEYWFIFGPRAGSSASAIRDPGGARAGRPDAGVDGGRHRAGVFANHPTAISTALPWVECPYCDPDGLGVVDLRRVGTQAERSVAGLVRRPGEPAGSGSRTRVVARCLTGTVPPDQAARHRITDDLGSTLFVEAGAGTGKTIGARRPGPRSVPGGRPNSTRSPPSPSPTKAAAELRDRIRRQLEERPIASPEPRNAGPRARSHSASSTGPPSAPCTPSPSACSPNIRSRRVFRPGSRCSTRSARLWPSNGAGGGSRDELLADPALERSMLLFVCGVRPESALHALAVGLRRQLGPRRGTGAPTMRPDPPTVRELVGSGRGRHRGGLREPCRDPSGQVAVCDSTRSQTGWPGSGPSTTSSTCSRPWPDERTRPSFKVGRSRQT